jgi:DNA modification methylase
MKTTHPIMVPLSKLKGNPDNPRILRDEKFLKLKKSISDFPDMLELPGDRGREPGRQYMVLGGNMRLRPCMDLKIKEAPVMLADHWTVEQRREFTIKDNVGFGEWDWDALANGWDTDQLQDWGMDLPGDFGIDASGGLTSPDEVPDVPANPLTVLGDVWIMGKHRIVCGDSTNAETVAKCLNGVKPHLMVTDPPYGVEYDPEWRHGKVDPETGVRTGKVSGGKMKDQAMGKVHNDDRADWREAWALFSGDVAYVWSAAGPLQVTVHDSLVASNLEVRQQIIWSKSRAPISRSHYHWKHEPCWYAVRKGKTGHWNGDRKQTTVWDIEKPQKSETGHSTQKPVECMKRPIENNSSPGQAVYEPFSGSGTTIIAGEMTGRAIHAIELSPEYVDVAVKRWQDFTGMKAIHEATGRTFEEVAAAVAQTAE